jgi:hypothetical protein
MNPEPTMTCDWCGKDFPADARACVEAGVHAYYGPEEGEEWKGNEPSAAHPDMLSQDQRDFLKAQHGLNDDELHELLTTGNVSGLGAIICVECQDAALENSEPL